MYLIQQQKTFWSENRDAVIDNFIKRSYTVVPVVFGRKKSPAAMRDALLRTEQACPGGAENQISEEDPDVQRLIEM